MLVGHKKIYDNLMLEAKQGRLHHCQIFLGPQHLGKTKTALQLAMHLQCPRDEQVVERKLIAEGLDSDTIIFEDDGEILPIEKVREIISRATVSHIKPYLIFIIENIGRLKIESMNALLKTLEEPAPGVLFFLTANKESDVLPTIRSRARVTGFQTLNKDEMRELCGESPFCDEMLSYAMGRPGKLVKLMEDEEYLKIHRDMNLIIQKFLENPNHGSAFEISRWLEKNEHLQEFLDLLLIRVRSLLLADQKPAILGHIDFAEKAEEIENAKGDILRNVNTKLLFENLLIKFVP